MADPVVIPSIILEFLSYDPLSGEFHWKRRAGTHALVGQRAGFHEYKGYWAVRFRGRNYRAHRLAWFFVHGTQPPDMLDHRNGIKDDNRIANLRAATPTQNAGNQKACRKGLKGVVFDKNPNRIKHYQGVITVAGRRRLLGYFETEAEAHAAYCAEAVRVFGEFARFQ